jgi:serine/threonine-protein kinase
MADLPLGQANDAFGDFGALRSGMRLGRYELLVPIAQGGMARVWAARLHGQRGFRKIVAIKTILPELACEPEFERMFLDEARIASGVHHPNVCEIYELGEEQGILYLAMEWVTGDTFSRLMRPMGENQIVDPRVAARVIADACAGLHVAHELTDDHGHLLNVVHRDISPQNLLVTGDGVTKIADFGVAKALNQLHDPTSAGQLKGKLGYMPPEQLLNGAIDRRSDVFSLGAILYEATTGQRPFLGDGDPQVMRALVNGDFTPPSAVVRGYPAELEQIIFFAMAASPAGRFPTAEKMRIALEGFLARGPIVTQGDVAQLLRARIGPQMERRRERIRQAAAAGDRMGSDPGRDGPA